MRYALAGLIAFAALPTLAEDYPLTGDWYFVTDETPSLDVDANAARCVEDGFVRFFPDGLVNGIERTEDGSFKANYAEICTMAADGNETCHAEEGSFQYYSYPSTSRSP